MSAFLETTSQYSLAEIALRLGTAVLLGSLIGLNRELQGRAAGLRTHTLVSLSAATTTLVAFEIFHTLRGLNGSSLPDPIRAIQGVAQAVGLICAGVIIQGRGNRVRNLTTAASMWMAGALGIACGAGHYSIAGIAAGLTLIVLIVYTAIEHRMFGHSEREPSDPTGSRP